MFGTRTIALVGGAVTGRRVNPESFGVVVSDSGFVADTGVALRGRYLPFETVRVGGIAGARRVRTRLRAMVMVPSPRLTSDHFSPQTSPLRRPSSESTVTNNWIG